MSGVLTRMAGSAIRDGALARDATEFVCDAPTPTLFDRSRRVFPWASLKAEWLSVEDDGEIATARRVVGVGS